MNGRFFQELTRDVVDASRVRPGERVGSSLPNTTGGILIRPGGHQCYPAFWIRDFAMSLECGFITPEEQRHALLLTAATQQAEDWLTPSGSFVPRGAIADHINFDRTPIFFPGTYDPTAQGGEWGKLPALDDHFYFVEMAWQYCRQTGGRGILGENVGRSTLLERLELAFSVPQSCPNTQLVWCDESNRGVSFGFTDSVIHTGELLFASLLRYRAARQLAELTGNSRYGDIADTIMRSLPGVFSHPGGLLRASTGLSSQSDVWGSAFAVYIGAVEGVVRDQICRALADACRAGTLAWRGNIRHVLTTDDFSAQSAWESTVGSQIINRYQNGAYWSTATGWVCFAIAQVDEPLAKQLADEFLEELREGDFRKGPNFGSPYECLHPDGNFRSNPVYMTSVTCPLAAFVRMGYLISPVRHRQRQADQINMNNTYQQIDGRRVRVGGWIGKRMELTWKNNLLALDWDGDFLRPFLEKQGKGGEYVGMGKTLDGLSRFASHTAAPELLALRRHVLDTLIGSQETDGYLGTYQPEKRITMVWDVHELAYVLFALVSDSRLFQEAPSLSAAIKLGDHLLGRLSDIPLPTTYNEATKSDLALELTMLGLDRALLALHLATQDRRYLDFCLEKLKLAEWDLPVVDGRHTKIEGHAYAYMTRCLAQLDLREITGGDGLLAQTRRALEYLRQKNGLVITGTCSQSECWHSDQDGTGELGETCTTAYWIRLCGRMLCLEGSGEYGDLMERAIYNALFAAQSPDGRRLRYYTPFEGKRVYWDKDTYCCPGNFRRIMAEMPELIYFTSPSGFLVNLYTDSQATIPLASGLTVEVVQKTDYPNSGCIHLSVVPSRPERFGICLRIPSWCQQFSAKVNGVEIAPSVDNGLLCIDREWNGGDVVELAMEMPWRLVRGLAKQHGRVAVMRGPLVFCLNPNRNAGNGQVPLIVDSAAFQSPVTDETLRPHGVACRQDHEPALLTEFPDPDGEATYFLPASNDILTADELLQSEIMGTEPTNQTPWKRANTDWMRDATGVFRRTALPG